MKIRTSGYIKHWNFFLYRNTPNYGRLLHVGETRNRFADFWLWIAQKCVWRPGSAWTRWGSYSALPDHLADIRGRERGGKGWE